MPSIAIRNFSYSMSKSWLIFTSGRTQPKRSPRNAFRDIFLLLLRHVVCGAVYKAIHAPAHAPMLVFRSLPHPIANRTERFWRLNRKVAKFIVCVWWPRGDEEFFGGSVEIHLNWLGLFEAKLRLLVRSLILGEFSLLYEFVVKMGQT